MDTKEFINKAKVKHGNRYSYIGSKYKGYFEPINVICPKCGPFYPTPSNHLAGTGCPVCACVKQRMTTDQFISLAIRVHGFNYDYSQTKYINARTKVAIWCKNCGEKFQQLPRGHIYTKSGCPKCRLSHGEEKISHLLKAMDVIYEQEKTFDDCIGVGGKPLRFDFYLTDLKICIEYDGRQHTDKNSKYWNETVAVHDEIKNQFCQRNDIVLLRINYTYLKDVESVLKRFLITPQISSTSAIAPSPNSPHANFLV